MLQEWRTEAAQAERPGRGHEQGEEQVPPEIESCPELRCEAQEEEINSLSCGHPARFEETEQPVQTKQGKEMREQLLVAELRQSRTAEGKEESSDPGRQRAESEAPTQEECHRCEVKKQDDNHPNLKRSIRLDLDHAEQPVDRRRTDEDFGVCSDVPGREEEGLVPEADGPEGEPAPDPAIGILENEVEHSRIAGVHLHAAEA